MTGGVPESYAWIQAAKYLECGGPWNLIERPDGLWWRNEALATMRAEAHGNEQRAKRAGKK